MKDVLDLVGLLRLATVQHPRRSPRAPTRLAALVKHEEVASHRNLSCAGYDACLGEVLQLGWTSWTCRRCARFELRGERALELEHEGVRRIEP
jgi:hypothetical protein